MLAVNTNFDNKALLMLSSRLSEIDDREIDSKMADMTEKIPQRSQMFTNLSTAKINSLLQDPEVQNEIFHTNLRLLHSR